MTVSTNKNRNVINYSRDRFLDLFESHIVLALGFVLLDFLFVGYFLVYFEGHLVHSLLPVCLLLTCLVCDWLFSPSSNQLLCSVTCM